MSIPIITITQAEYDKLLKDSEFLGALQAAGVDNWSGYSYAQDLMSGPDDESEDETYEEIYGS